MNANNNAVCARCEGDASNDKHRNTATFSSQKQKWTFVLGRMTLYCEKAATKPLSELEEAATNRQIVLCDRCCMDIHWAHNLYDGFTVSSNVDDYHSPPCERGW